MHVETEGPSGAPDVVCLHGGIGTGRYHWSKLIEPLARSYRLHLPDLPGHGRTALLPGMPYGRAMHVTAVRELLADLDAPPIVMGFSMGGHATLGLLGEDPTAARAIVVIGVSLHDHEGLHTWRKKFRPDAFAESYPLWVRQLEKLHAEQEGGWRAVLERDSRLEAGVDEEALAAYDRPALLVRGDSDETVQPGQYARLRELWPQAEEFVVPAGGHDVQLTRSRVVEGVLLDFLSRVVD